jgi:hypothetical protein
MAYPNVYQDEAQALKRQARVKLVNLWKGFMLLLSTEYRHILVK